MFSSKLVPVDAYLLMILLCHELILSSPRFRFWALSHRSISAFFYIYGRLTAGLLIVTMAFRFDCWASHCYPGVFIERWASCLFLCVFYPEIKPFLHAELHVCAFPGERPSGSFFLLASVFLGWIASSQPWPSPRILHFYLNS
jgi:hypothetical protein